ncbi:acyl carrier protein [Achromobacter deleyi]|uniref:acyl carrier protein n=1 Tax=Achromobacter deleyi TaxID=1353891 RepID=UPI001492200B|nr:acyl carrier protein [Achromobacter deleyi]QVQ28233.1 acyl carrier protein [Achromobacter deleyi]UIP18428.1 acyl carrier protein [Achromobacter deleyi]
MTDAEILSALTDIFRDIFDDDTVEVNLESSAADFDAWDSLSNVNIMVATEMRFGVRFKTSEVEGLRNVGELLALIRKQLSARA